ncbi:hypothetical protein R6Q57_005119 [Mikania cordata]
MIDTPATHTYILTNLTQKPQNYGEFVDLEDGYSYYYPSDWTEFDFRGHDSAFKDRYLQLQNVRLNFIPTDKTDIHDMVFSLSKNRIEFEIRFGFG